MSKFITVGENRAYEQGLNDAWSLSRQIADICHELEPYQIKEIFKKDIEFSSERDKAATIMDNVTPAYAQERLNAYHLRVGDIVSREGHLARYIVVYIDIRRAVANIVNLSTGTVFEDYEIAGLSKTGKHIDLKKVLSEVGE